MEHEFKIGDDLCRLSFGQYENGRVAIQIVYRDDDASEEYGEDVWFPYATATVNIPEAELADGEVLIKDWSENAGLLDRLVDEGIIGPSKRWVPTGFVTADVCDLLVNP